MNILYACVHTRKKLINLVFKIVLKEKSNSKNILEVILDGQTSINDFAITSDMPFQYIIIGKQIL